MRSISGDACYMQRVFSISTSDNCHQTFLSYSKIKYNSQPNKTLSDMIFIKLINGFFYKLMPNSNTKLAMTQNVDTINY